MDINTKKLKKNAFRVTKTRGITALRIRVPGGHLPVKYLDTLKEIAETYGNGTMHITTRQGFEILGIKIEDMDKVNKLIQPVIEGLNINQVEAGKGYTSAGTRNVTSCIGNKVCPYANYNTTELAKVIENEIFPHDFHFKVALTGCANDCIKARMHDFGIMGMTEPQYDPDRCVACGACEKACRIKSTDALTIENYKIKRDPVKCIGCGECVINCPTRAFTRSKEKYYRLAIMGRTGKKNPRLAEDFLIWTDAESIVKIINNTYKYVDKYLDRGAPGGKEHIGYIIDRTGFEEYKKWALEGVTLPPEAIMNEYVYWSGIHYKLPSYR